MSGPRRRKFVSPIGSRITWHGGRGRQRSRWALIIALAILDRDAPVAAVFLRRVVAGRLVIRAAVVPDDDVPVAPPVTVLGVGLDHAVGQLLDQRIALALVEPLDAQDLSGIEVERLPPGLGMLSL